MQRLALVVDFGCLIFYKVFKGGIVVVSFVTSGSCRESLKLKRKKQAKKRLYDYVIAFHVA